jgi:hypothetical protein
MVWLAKNHGDASIWHHQFVRKHLSTKQALPPNLGHVKICACSFPELLREVTDYPGKASNLKLGDNNANDNTT